MSRALGWDNDEGCSLGFTCGYLPVTGHWYLCIGDMGSEIPRSPSIADFSTACILRVCQRAFLRSVSRRDTDFTDYVTLLQT